MNIALSQERFANGISIFDIGCVVKDADGKAFKILDFSGYSEIDEADGTEQEHITVHLMTRLKSGEAVDDIRVVLDDFERDIWTGALTPVSPDWFIEEVEFWRMQDNEDTEAKAIEVKAEAKTKRELAEMRDRIYPSRPVEHYTDAELFAKVSGAPLSVAEDLLTSYEANLKQMAGSTAKQLQKVSGIGTRRSEKIAAAFELAKRLARFHATKPKITAPSDVADLMMSKMRYLQREIVCVLCLDTKGGVTSTGTISDSDIELKWDQGHKVLAEETVFEGTLNMSVFHPREIFRFAIEESANSIVLCHNHPSGDPQPSQEDIRATKQLIEAGKAIGIKVLDHIIIGDGIFVSLKEESFI